MNVKSPEQPPTEHPGAPLPAVSALPLLDRILDDLPPAFCVACQGVLRLAVGPSGVFVLSSDQARAVDDGEPLDADLVAFMLAKAAGDTRNLLADHLGWGPFVDSLFVVEQQLGRTPAAVTTVPLDLVRSTLVEGRPAVSERQLAAVRQLLREDRFGSWAFCLPGDTIDLSDSARNALPRG